MIDYRLAYLEFWLGENQAEIEKAIESLFLADYAELTLGIILLFLKFFIS